MILLLDEHDLVVDFVLHLLVLLLHEHVDLLLALLDLKYPDDTSLVVFLFLAILLLPQLLHLLLYLLLSLVISPRLPLLLERLLPLPVQLFLHMDLLQLINPIKLILLPDLSVLLELQLPQQLLTLALFQVQRSLSVHHQLLLKLLLLETKDEEVKGYLPFSQQL